MKGRLLPSPSLWNVRVVCAPDDAQAVENALTDGALSVSTFALPRAETASVELLLDAPPDEAALRARIVLALAAARRSSSFVFSASPTPNLDWIKKVAQDFPPLPVARWTIFGAAHKDKIKNPRLALQIDATSAFGTGEHPTTRGCLLLLHEILKKSPQAGKWSALDMGCGSGILAMAFCKASRGRALGIDSDPPSIKIAKENSFSNGLKDFVRVKTSLGYRDLLVGQEGPYDLVMANIFARPLCLMAKDIRPHLKPGGWAVLSGILQRQTNAVLAAHRAQGLFLVKRLRLGEWTALALRASSGA